VISPPKQNESFVQIPGIFLILRRAGALAVGRQVLVLLTKEGGVASVRTPHAIQRLLVTYVALSGDALGDIDGVVSGTKDRIIPALLMIPPTGMSWRHAALLLIVLEPAPNPVEQACWHEYRDEYACMYVYTYVCI
jgi:hypothetical protein